MCVCAQTHGQNIVFTPSYNSGSTVYDVTGVMTVEHLRPRSSTTHATDTRRWTGRGGRPHSTETKRTHRNKKRWQSHMADDTESGLGWLIGSARVRLLVLSVPVTPRKGDDLLPVQQYLDRREAAVSQQIVAGMWRLLGWRRAKCMTGGGGAAGRASGGQEGTLKTSKSIH